MEVTRRFLGIDPGKGGGITLLNHDGGLLHGNKTPTFGKEYDLPGMVTLLTQYSNPFVPTSVIEKVGAFPGQGVAGMFNFGMGYGFWQGMMAAMAMPYEFVLPRTWQTVTGIGKVKTATERKKAVVAWALRRWPTITPHSGICEAAAMAEWLRQRET